MRPGTRWLFAGALAMAAAVAAPAMAQNPRPGAPRPGTPVFPSTGAPVISGTGGAITQPGSFQPPPAIRPGQPLSVLVFPFTWTEDTSAAPDPAAVESIARPLDLNRIGARHATAAVKAGLQSTPFYAITTYQPQSSLIERARHDDVLKPDHLAGLVADNTGAVNLDKARIVAQRLGIQAILIGATELKHDRTANTAELTLDTRVINSITGETLRSAAVSASATGAASVPMADVVDRAALAAAVKVLPELGVELVAALPVATKDADGSHGPLRRRGTYVQSGSSSKSTDKKAAGQAKKDADEERSSLRAAQKAKRDAEREREKGGDRSDAGSNVDEARAAIERFKRGEAPLPKKASDQEDSQQPPAATAQPAPPATPTPPPAAPGISGLVQPPTQKNVAIQGTVVPGTATEAGIPDPYAYARTTKLDGGTRRRSGLRVPPWMGLLGYVAGVAFLLK